MNDDDLPKVVSSTSNSSSLLDDEDDGGRDAHNQNPSSSSSSSFAGAKDKQDNDVFKESDETFEDEKTLATTAMSLDGLEKGLQPPHVHTHHHTRPGGDLRGSSHSAHSMLSSVSADSTASPSRDSDRIAELRKKNERLEQQLQASMKAVHPLPVTTSALRTSTPAAPSPLNSDHDPLPNASSTHSNISVSHYQYDRDVSASSDQHFRHSGHSAASFASGGGVHGSSARPSRRVSHQSSAHSSTMSNQTPTGPWYKLCFKSTNQQWKIPWLWVLGYVVIVGLIGYGLAVVARL